MNFSKVFYGGGGQPSPVDSGSQADGVIYAINQDGHLLWYRDSDRHGQNGPNAERGWAAGSGSQIGRDWNEFSHVFSGGDGIIYGVTQDGRLLWYKDDDRQGTNGPNAERGWAAGSGNQIGRGWNEFSHVFSDGAGTIYGITQDGRLQWYRDDDRQGTNGPNAERGWAVGSGNQIGRGWNEFSQVFSSGGVIYGITQDGRLQWYRDDDRQGTNGPNAERGWAAGSGNQIGTGWNKFSLVFGGGFESPTLSEEGGIIIYAVTPGGELVWYRDANIQGMNAPDGSTGWSEGSGNRIGIGW